MTAVKRKGGMPVERYRVPPKSVFRKMGLGVPVDGYIRVVAGFRFKWWVPDYAGPIEPIIVNARILRIKPGSSARRTKGR